MELAVARLAFSTLSPIINRLVEYDYKSSLGGDVTADEMIRLKVFCIKIMLLIREMEQNPSDQLRQLLENLQDIAFEVEDLLDLYDYKQIKYQVSYPNAVEKYILKLKENLGFMVPKSSLRITLEKLLKFAEEIEIPHSYYKSPQVSTTQTASNHSSPYFGRAKQCDTIIDLLLGKCLAKSNKDIEKDPIIAIRGLTGSGLAKLNKGIKRVPIIAIIGLGGSGKTITAQRVYNDDSIKDFFDLRMWVRVSRTFDVRRLTIKIIECAIDGECPQINNLSVLQSKLKELISKRMKFLLVLDDIWCAERMQWDQLLSPLNEVGSEGSKIMITTRMEEVTSILRVEEVISLEELTAVDCWSILKYHAFDNHEEIIKDKELINAGNQIIKKVRFSPLALRVVGSSLKKRNSVSEWENILKGDMLKETMNVLLYSFLHLPTHLQRCFAYCSLFPKGYKFQLGCYHRQQLLIPLWISQGLIEKTSELTAEEEGLIYIKELMSYSFFEKQCDDYFVIPDLLHDLAESVSNQCHGIEHKDSLNIPTTCIHLSIDRAENLESIDISALNLKKLRSLLIFDDVDSTDIFRDGTGAFNNLTKLRALYVKSDRQMQVLSKPNINKLKHLRFLHVEYNKQLPAGLAELYHLKYFQLTTDVDGRYLPANTLPRGFGNLINLRSLKFYGKWGDELDYLRHHSKEISIEKLKSILSLPFGWMNYKEMVLEQ